MPSAAAAAANQRSATLVPVHYKARGLCTLPDSNWRPSTPALRTHTFHSLTLRARVVGPYTETTAQRGQRMWSVSAAAIVGSQPILGLYDKNSF